MHGDEGRPALVAAASAANVARGMTERPGRGIVGAVDTVMFLGVILFSTVAVLAIALSAPLVIAVSAVAAAFSGETVRGGWRIVRTI